MKGFKCQLMCCVNHVCIHVFSSNGFVINFVWYITFVNVCASNWMLSVSCLYWQCRMLCVSIGMQPVKLHGSK